MHVLVGRLVRKVLLQLFQQRVESLMLGLLDANSGEHALIRQISFGQLSWIEHGDLVTLVHEEHGSEVSALLKPLVF